MTVEFGQAIPDLVSPERRAVGTALQNVITAAQHALVLIERNGVRDFEFYKVVGPVLDAAYEATRGAAGISQRSQSESKPD
ncbi:hypothetical protein HY389_00225 [Candidatus Daviesbacteria bacterium]|nr:hypothetical protein [Candidatus Daviesbacteria bacterium]